MVVPQAQRANVAESAAREEVLRSRAQPRQSAILNIRGSHDERPSYGGLISFAFFILCGAVTIALDKPPRPVSQEAPLTAFSAERAAKHLAAISRAPHPINSAEHDLVRDYILRTLRDLGFAPEVQRTTDVNERYGIGGALENILCRLKGSSRQKAVLLAAHYDSVSAGTGASDDGVAVAALLESARTLKLRPQLRRDVIFLFTDGEERGLLGARAFVSEHPWARDAGFVLNFEARGTDGPSIMFETSDENGWLIKNFSQATSHPVGNSLSYEIYKRMPNDTDFTVFRHAGYSGLNFAFIGGVARYHTRLDSIANVNYGSLQHHGDYMLELTERFGNASSDDPRLPNAVYFDVLGRMLITYQRGTATFLLLFAAALTALTFYLGFRKQCLRAGACLGGLLSMVVAVVVTVTGSGAVFWIISAAGRSFPRIHTGLVYESGWYISACSAFGLALAIAFYSVAANWISSENLAAGSLPGWMGLAAAVHIYFPGGSYLFFWPLMFSILGWIAAFALRGTSIKAARILLAVGGLPAIVVIVPMIHKIFFAFAAQSALIVNSLLGLLLSLLIAPMAVERFSNRWLLPGLLAVAGLGLLGTAIAVSAVA
jgi:Peptidase family M28